MPLTVRRLRDVSKEAVDITHDCPIIVQGLFCGCLGGIQNDVGENQICLNFSAALVHVAVQLREGRRRNSWDDRKVSSSTAARHRSPAYSQGRRFDGFCRVDRRLAGAKKLDDAIEQAGVLRFADTSLHKAAALLAMEHTTERIVAGALRRRSRRSGRRHGVEYIRLLQKNPGHESLP